MLSYDNKSCVGSCGDYKKSLDNLKCIDACSAGIKYYINNAFR